MSERIVEHIVDVSVPEEIVNAVQFIIPQRPVLNRTTEQIVYVPVLQLLDETVEARAHFRTHFGTNPCCTDCAQDHEPRSICSEQLSRFLMFLCRSKDKC